MMVSLNFLVSFLFFSVFSSLPSHPEIWMIIFPDSGVFPGSFFAHDFDGGVAQDRISILAHLARNTASIFSNSLSKNTGVVGVGVGRAIRLSNLLPVEGLAVRAHTRLHTDSPCPSVDNVAHIFFALWPCHQRIIPILFLPAQNPISWTRFFPLCYCSFPLVNLVTSDWVIMFCHSRLAVNNCGTFLILKNEINQTNRYRCVCVSWSTDRVD